LFQQVEEKLAELNKRKSTLESAMAAPATYSDKNKFLQTEKEYNATNGEISRLSKQYEEIFERIITLENLAG
ncbi:MAG: ABC transporter ATP-binding protein, partial [Bacteroidetes bacterium]|nr:ABC transporter ATP-binding protein [Bacteroidota bacterium]